MTHQPLEPVESLPASLRWQRIMLVAAEVALVLVILALLVANWVPILIGARAQRPG